MKLDSSTHVDTAMLIRRPAGEAYEAFIDPAITTKFWFTESTGRLEKGKEVEWTWRMYNATGVILVKDLVPDRKIGIEWGPKGAARSRAEWTFEAVDAQSVFVTVAVDGFAGDEMTVFNNIIGSVTGSCWVLAAAKAWLEHGIQLNLIGDRFPKGK
ncbi:MAG TPA: SRPBCC domain-containing protein [Puia sp.]|nr:SRPBCC domain-containing protein [Puia sp.]